MNLIDILDNFPSYLGSDVILEIEPQYIDQYKRLRIIDSDTTKRYHNKWYLPILLNIKDNRISHQQGLQKILKLRHYELFDRLWEDYLEKYGLDVLDYRFIHEILEISALIGNLDIIQMILNLIKGKFYFNYDYQMGNAAMGGHLEIVKLMLEYGATNYNETMMNAAAGGSPAALEIVKLMLDVMKESEIRPDYYWTMSNAKGECRFEIMKLMLNLIKENEIEPDYKGLMSFFKAKDPEMIELIKNFRSKHLNS